MEEVNVNEKYTAIIELDEMLTKHNIPHFTSRAYDGYIIEYYTPEGKLVGDVIQHKYSYGNALNLMESAKFGQKGVSGNLTVEEAFTLFKEAHERTVKSHARKNDRK